MTPKHKKLQIFIAYKTFTVGIKTKNLPQTTKFALQSFYKVFYKTTTCKRQSIWLVARMVVFWFVDDDWGLTVLIKDNSFCVHQQNIHRLMIEIHKIFNNMIDVYKL